MNGEKKRIKIKNVLDAVQAFKKYHNKRQENLVLLTLNGNHEVIKIHHICKGIANQTLIHPRELFYPAIKDNAIAIIVCHNHPSGNITPSPNDNKITERIKMSSEILGFSFLDHIIVSNDSKYYSYREKTKKLNKNINYNKRKQMYFSRMIAAENIIDKDNVAQL
jgi:DNA repair protein RadC